MNVNEKELIEKGIIDSSQVCISCGKRYAPDGLLCHSCYVENFYNENHKEDKKSNYSILNYLK